MFGWMSDDGIVGILLLMLLDVVLIMRLNLWFFSSFIFNVWILLVCVNNLVNFFARDIVRLVIVIV